MAPPSNLSDHDAALRALASPRDGRRAAARERARPLLAALGEGATHSLHLAAALGDADRVQEILRGDPAAANATGGPFHWTPLTHLCFSVFLDAPAEVGSPDFIAAATALLSAGADPNAGFEDPKARPEIVFYPCLYGAAHLAHHDGLTRLLLAHGADPNQPEVAYHAAEGYDDRALHALVESGRCTAVTLTTFLLRKCDWHDLQGLEWLLAHGADPNTPTPWGTSVLHHAIARGNHVEMIHALLDRGADPAARHPVFGSDEPASAIAAAARHGRGDVLDTIARRGIPLRVEGVDALLAACARGHAPAVEHMADTMVGTVDALHAMAAPVLARFAGCGNSAGLRLLLGLGLPVDARDAEGDAYFQIAPMSTPLHVAAWRGWPTAVRALVTSGADVHARDGADRTPLQLAVKACVDSYWSDRRSPESVQTLLSAGATAEGIALPCGYLPVDALLTR